MLTSDRATLPKFYTVREALRRPRNAAYLGVLEDVHDEDGETQAEDVGRKAGVEVGVGVLLQAAGKVRGRG